MRFSTLCLVFIVLLAACAKADHDPAPVVDADHLNGVSPILVDSSSQTISLDSSKVPILPDCIAGYVVGRLASGNGWECRPDAGILSIAAAAPLIAGTGQNPTLALGLIPISLGGTGISSAPTASGQFFRSSAAGTWAISTIADSDLPADVVTTAGGKISATILPAAVPLLDMNGKLSVAAFPSTVAMLNGSGVLPDSAIGPNIARVPSGSGVSAASPATSCKAIKTAQASAQSGIYWLRPSLGVAAFPAWCDMEDDNGGWTLFYSGRNGAPRVRFDQTAADCPDPRFDCVRRLPSGTTASTVELAASCGSSMTKFTADATAIQLFRDGTNPGAGQFYQPISNVTAIFGPVTNPPDTLYVGTSGPGWFLINLSLGAVFASGYSPGYNGCGDLSSDNGTPAVLYWRETP